MKTKHIRFESLFKLYEFSRRNIFRLAVVAWLIALSIIQANSYFQIGDAQNDVDDVRSTVEGQHAPQIRDLESDLDQAKREVEELSRRRY